MAIWWYTPLTDKPKYKTKLATQPLLDRSGSWSNPNLSLNKSSVHHQNGFAFCKRPNFGTTLNWRGSQISNYLSQRLNHLKSLGPKSLLFLAKRMWGLWIFSHELSQINQVTLCDAPQSPVWSPIAPRWSGLRKSTENCWNIRVSCRFFHPILVIVSVDKGNHETQASTSPKLPLTGALIESHLVVCYDPILNPQDTQGLGKSRPEICLS